MIPNPGKGFVPVDAGSGRRSLEYEELEEAALRRAYPTIPERVCAETVAFDYRLGPDNWYVPGDPPTDAFEDARRLLCKMMRLAYEEGADWLVEVLEYEREGASAFWLLPACNPSFRLYYSLRSSRTPRSP